MTVTYSLEYIDRVAKELLKKATSKVLLFNAPMGAGKTTLIKALCKELKVKQEITSPTFSLVNEYVGENCKVFHFDLYRLENREQLYDMGFEEYIDQDAYCFIEWPELAVPFLENYQKIEIEIVNSSKRNLKLG